MATVVSANRPDSIGQTRAIRATVLDLAEHLDYQLTLEELVRFLPHSTLIEFIEHLHTVADIEDLIG